MFRLLGSLAAILLGGLPPASARGPLCALVASPRMRTICANVRIKCMPGGLAETKARSSLSRRV